MMRHFMISLALIVAPVVACAQNAADGPELSGMRVANSRSTSPPTLRMVSSKSETVYVWVALAMAARLCETGVSPPV